MPLTVHPDLPPLRTDQYGAVRVGACRVLYYLVVHAFKDGNTPEQIVEMYDTLDLADVYVAVGYYIRHTAEVEAFLEEYDRSAAEIRERIEARQGSQVGMRERLLQRIRDKKAAEANNGRVAPPVPGGVEEVGHQPAG